MDVGTFASDGLPRTRHRILTSRGILVATFAAVAAVELAYHEMWLDELNPWVIARDANSLSQLFVNVRFEPHPRLWYLCLYALTRVTRNPVGMQMFHGAIAIASVALLAYCSPFRRRDVWLLAFGYYFVFEYCAISRGYALGVLLALTACALACAPRPHVILVAVLLALLANTSIFGLILSLALVVAIASSMRKPRATIAAAAIAILASGVALSAWTLVPSPESTFGRDRHFEASATRADYVGNLLGEAYVPLPNWTRTSPWNSSALVDGGRYVPYIGHYTPLITGAVIFILAIAHLRRQRGLMAALALGTAGLLGLMYVEYSAGYRHHGHLFVLLLVVLWLSASQRLGTDVRVTATPRWLPFMLAAQVPAGLYFAVADFERPFSASKDVAHFLETRSLQQMPVVVAQPNFLSYLGPAISAYLNRRVYYAISGGVVRGSYLWYDDIRAHMASEEEIVQDIRQFADDRGTDVIVVVSHWDSARLGERIAQFPRNTIESDEGPSAVYLFKRRQ